MFMRQSSTGPFGKPVVSNQKNGKFTCQTKQMKGQILSSQARLKIHEKMEQEKKLEQLIGGPYQSAVNGSSTKYNRFYINIQQPADQTDSTIAWVCPPFIPIANQRARNLYFKQQDYLINNYYGSDYPRIIWIVCQGLDGYLDGTGAPTHTVSALVLSQISSNVDSSGEKFLDLLYTQKDQVTWPIPNNYLPVFKIKLDNGNFVNFPSTNGIQLNFQIRQIGI